ncbi:hypothetical protein FSP39_004734 [Pinctada imbricata]|uniref:FkbM family methyltransferase n=1 Tax=Pinctada imbricata TaxID=66713 RepID=A0AA89BSF6_PINIB|nr:hypothetical protein FSP39_004734 [Pinctada imbricata]
MGWIRQPYKPGSIPIDVQSTPSLTKTDTPGAALEDLQIVTYQDSIIRGKTVLPALALSNYRSKILSRNMTSWYFNDKVCRGISNETGKFVLAHLRAPQYIPIYVYEENEDVWVSGNVIKRGMWEIELVVKIQGILAEDLDTTFIDIGANVGVYALTAAKLGCKVVAIDAFEGNIARLCKSIEAGNLTRNIVLIHNAVSNTREKVAIEVGKRNIGGTYVRKINQTFQDRYVVNSILLDDLLEVLIPSKGRHKDGRRNI